jgi:hypothetical protein
MIPKDRPANGTSATMSTGIFELPPKQRHPERLRSLLEWRFFLPSVQSLSQSDRLRALPRRRAGRGRTEGEKPDLDP